jgi:hypothetical protein
VLVKPLSRNIVKDQNYYCWPRITEAERLRMIGENSRRTDGSYVTTFVAAPAQERLAATAPQLPVSAEKFGAI